MGKPLQHRSQMSWFCVKIGKTCYISTFSEIKRVVASNEWSIEFLRKAEILRRKPPNFIMCAREMTQIGKKNKNKKIFETAKIKYYSSLRLIPSF